jgi:hypothetical protein
MKASFAPIAEPLLFSWEPPQRQKVAIVTFLVISLIAHALCFYIFQIVYPPTVSLLPPPARISVITSNSEEGRALLRWIDAEDPALAFTTQRPPGAKLRALPKVEHAASYFTAEPVLKEIPPLVVDLRIPSSQPPGPVHFGRRQNVPAMTPAVTSISFSKELDTRGVPILPQTSFVASNDQPPETIRFRIAVNTNGEIHYCFPFNSSGDPVLDEQARRSLTLCRFPPSSITDQIGGKSLIWGIATVEWGTDVTPRKATPTVTATP